MIDTASGLTLQPYVLVARKLLVAVIPAVH